MKIRALVVTLATALLTACAGSAFTMNDARQVRVGMTTAELQAVMKSNPYSVTSRGDTQIWIWSEANGFTGSHQSVSFVVKEGKVYSVPVIPASFN